MNPGYSIRGSHGGTFFPPGEGFVGVSRCYVGTVLISTTGIGVVTRATGIQWVETMDTATPTKWAQLPTFQCAKLDNFGLYLGSPCSALSSSWGV